LRICLSTASLYLYPLRLIFTLAKDTGFEGLELVLGPEVMFRGADYVRRLAQQYALPIASLHPPMIPIPGWREHHKLLPQMAPLARDLACKLIVIHAPKALSLVEGTGREYSVAVQACTKELREGSPRLCVENQAVFRPGDREYVLSTPASLYRFAEDHDLALTLDTAHAASFPYDLLQAYETLAGRLANVHLSDFRPELSIPPWFNLQSYFKHHQMPGDGDLPLIPLLERLKADSYQGLVTLEVSPVALEAWHPRRARENLRRCLEYVNAALGRS
jgi:sugar phosphate isomerase/epimerase